MAKKKINFNFGNLTSLLLLGIVIVLIGILFSRFDPTSTPTEPAKNLKLFFFLNARSGTFVEDTEEENVYTLTLQSTSPTITYVARSPDNYFGRIRTGSFVSTIWRNDSQHKFSKDAPNATLVIYNSEKRQEDVIELELTDPELQGGTLQFRARKASSSNPKVKSFFDDNLTDFPIEFSNPTLVIDLSKSDVKGNMLEILTTTESTSQ